MRLFLEGDPNTITRRPSVRRFAQENGVRHIICNGKWLIDYKEFFKKVNPRRIRRTATMPAYAVLEIVLRSLIRITANTKLIKQRFLII